MKKKYTLLILGGALVLYVLIINLLSSYSFQNTFNNSNNSSYSGEAVKLNLGDSVGVSIIRNRWYGKIYEEGNSKILYILGVIRLPIEQNNKDYTPFHAIFLILWFFVLVRILTLKEEVIIEKQRDEVGNIPREQVQSEPIQKTQDLNSLNNQI